MRKSQDTSHEVITRYGKFTKSTDFIKWMLEGWMRERDERIYIRLGEINVYYTWNGGLREVREEVWSISIFTPRFDEAISFLDRKGIEIIQMDAWYARGHVRIPHENGAWEFIIEVVKTL